MFSVIGPALLREAKVILDFRTALSRKLLQARNNRTINTAVNETDTKKYARCNMVFILTELTRKCTVLGKIWKGYGIHCTEKLETLFISALDMKVLYSSP